MDGSEFYGTEAAVATPSYRIEAIHDQIAADAAAISRFLPVSQANLCPMATCRIRSCFNRNAIPPI
jgi:hypothetical protein